MNTWKFDPVHSSVEFKVLHLGISWVRGYFTNVTGTINFDSENPEKSSCHAEIETKSIHTGNDMRDGHLKGKDFFDADNNPVITFDSTKVEKAGGNKYNIAGNLTMKGITKPVVLSAEFLGAQQISSVDGKPSTTKAGFSAETTVNRHDFNISWDAPLGIGKTTIGSDVKISINIEAIKE